MLNVNEIRQNVEAAEDALGHFEKEKDQGKRQAAWKAMTARLANAKALADMARVRAKDQAKADDELFVRRCVVAYIEALELSAMGLKL